MHFNNLKGVKPWFFYLHTSPTKLKHYFHSFAEPLGLQLPVRACCKQTRHNSSWKLQLTAKLAWLSRPQIAQ